ncbi:MAG: hypothetical protein ACK4F9_03170 [Brevinematia bacterium]
MKRSFLISLIVFVLCFGWAFALNNKTITVVSKDKDSKFQLWLESKLSGSGKVNLFNYFANVDDSFDEISLIVENKLSGVLVIKESTLFVFTPKGLVTNMALSDTNMDKVAEEVVRIFPPEVPEKIVKEIKEIDYVSPLEVKSPKHSLSLQLGTSFQALNVRTILTDANFNVYERRLDYSDYSPPISIFLGYHFDSRYFSLSLILSSSLDSNISSIGMELIPGFWLFKGFMFVGLDLVIHNVKHKLYQEFYDKWNVLRNVEVSFLTLYVLPIFKFKLSKDDIIGVSPLISFSYTLSGNNVNLELLQSYKGEEGGPPMFIGINTYLEMKVVGNISLDLSIKIVTHSFNRSGSIVSNPYLKFMEEILMESRVGFKYKL